ncbi:MaoC/PaaZ C-terminal domain-containing protein [Streptomyces scopuliridis]|uniref:MaoC/PaaZ C-terminal domain-containing protein n=1 Tax=Streptomyces scopuliridis TaxID=452529 RepID=UPI0036B0A646
MSGDRDPIHLHPLTARLFGFPRAIAHGVWRFARCVAEAEAEAGTGGQVSSVRTEFRAPVLLPATVTFGARTGPEGSVACQLRDGDGTRVHLTGELSPSSPAPSSAPPP